MERAVLFSLRKRLCILYFKSQTFFAIPMIESYSPCLHMLGYLPGICTNQMSPYCLLQWARKQSTTHLPHMCHIHQELITSYTFLWGWLRLTYLDITLKVCDMDSSFLFPSRKISPQRKQFLKGEVLGLLKTGVPLLMGRALAND